MSSTRRSILGLMGAAPLAASGVLAAGRPAYADAGSSRLGKVLDGLKPGGALDQFVAAQAADDEFSGSLLLTYRGRAVLASSYGLADKQQAVPNGPDTRFALASVTKLFTAVAIAQLAQRGKVAYDGKLGDYLTGRDRRHRDRSPPAHPHLGPGRPHADTGLLGDGRHLDQPRTGHGWDHRDHPAGAARLRARRRQPVQQLGLPPARRDRGAGRPDSPITTTSASASSLRRA